MWKLAITVVALLPSLWSLWQAGGMPHLGYFHDDGLYAGTAAAIAEGRGFRIENLPGEPWQVKYPPLFPFYLALGARWEWAMTFLVWVLLPALLYQVWRWRGDAAMVVLIGWNMYSVVFAGTTLSELFGTCLLIYSVRLMEAGRTRPAAVAAGLAYLARTALIAWPAGALLWLAWKRRWREAAVFAAIVAVFFTGWSAYVAMHQTAGITKGTIYYLSYTQFFKDNMDRQILPTVLSINLQSLVQSLGGVLFFNSGESFWEMNFARLLLLASVAGLVRQLRKDGPSAYMLMAPFYMGVLTVWNFVPNERFLYPLLPLLLDGLLTELRHFRDMLRVTWTTQRGATVVLGAIVAAGALWMVERNAKASWLYAPSIPRNALAMKPDREKAYAWIRANTPESANFLTYEDPALRRHTGRHAIGIHCPTRLFYSNDNAAIYAYHMALADSMREENLQFMLIGPADLSMDIREADREKILANWKTRPELETVYQNDRYMIRKLRPLQSGM